MRYLLVLIMLPFLAFATSVSIATKVLTQNEASNLGINRLVSGNQSNWIVLVYPHQANDGQKLTEIIVTLSESGERITTFPAQIRNFEIAPWKRLDLVLEKHSKRIMQVEITYGSISYVVENVMDLQALEYEQFTRQYNKPIKRD
ncbi:hypothetical protein [Colwellia psychrerythraea]|uniref:Uncharacterized protein n=1 Tax=Colwellia psychrerythraea TaxID=28229 RepID=A0A099KUI9_COLPS|nr:hypothetical protein [Colwellia psychrerythraea]KGJ94186.1 hypothetical protein ND2E_2119 [Colwellia psychrerythraea]